MDTRSPEIPKCSSRWARTIAGETGGLVPTTMARSASDKASSAPWRARVRGTTTSPSNGVLARILGEAGGACALRTRNTTGWLWDSMVRIPTKSSMLGSSGHVYRTMVTRSCPTGNRGRDLRFRRAVQTSQVARWRHDVGLLQRWLRGGWLAHRRDRTLPTGGRRARGGRVRRRRAPAARVTTTASPLRKPRGGERLRLPSQCPTAEGWGQSLAWWPATLQLKHMAGIVQSA